MELLANSRFATFVRSLRACRALRRPAVVATAVLASNVALVATAQAGYGINGAACVATTLQDAINLAGPGGTVTIEAGTIVLLNSTVTISDHVSIRAGQANSCAVDTSGSKRTISAAPLPNPQLFDITGGLVTFENLDLVGGSAGSGGTMQITGSATAVTVISSDIRGGTATTTGGCISIGSEEGRPGLMLSGTSSVTGCSVTGTLPGTGGGGGAIHADNADIFMVDTARIADSTSTSDGGNVFMLNSSLSMIEQTVIEGGVADFNGGNVFMTSEGTGMSDVQMEDDSVLRDGFAAFDGGGLLMEGDSDLTMRDVSEISGNEATWLGGGIATSELLGSLLLLDQTAIDGNEASVGGGIYIDGLLVAGEEHTIGRVGSGNVARERGGGLYAFNASLTFTGADWTIPSAGAVPVGGTRVVGNRALNQSGAADYGGGGLYLAHGTTMLGESMVIAGNWGHDTTALVPVGVGGAVVVESSTTAEFISTSFMNNHAVDGGAIYVKDAILELDGSIGCDPTVFPINRYCSEIRQNTALGNGGGILADDGALITVLQTAVVGNDAAGNAAAMQVLSGAATSVDTSIFGGQQSPGGDSVDVHSGGTFDALQTTFGEGLAVTYAVGSAGSWTDTIIWDPNDPLGGAGLVATPAITGNCNMGNGVGALPGLTNLDGVDPVYQTTGNPRGTLMLDLNLSPAVDQPCASTVVKTDIEKVLRPFPVAGAGDMGAYEAN